MAMSKSDEVEVESGLKEGGPKSVSEVITFYEVAQLLEKLSEKGNRDKVKLLTSYFDHYRKIFKQIHHGSLSTKDNGDSLYPIVRIFLSHKDRARGAYGLQSATLGRIYTKVLGLNENSVDGKKLLHHKDPTKSGNYASGDLGTVVYSVLKPRQADKKGPSANSPRLNVIHQVLDKLAKKDESRASTGTTQEVQRTVLQKIINDLTALEAKWLTRILLKNLEIGIQEHQILKSVHPQAGDIVDSTTNLEEICLKLNDNEAKLSNSDLDIVLFQHFKFMLCTRVLDLDQNGVGVEDSFDDLNDDEDKSKNSKEKKVGRKRKNVILPDPPFLLETKWDGERFQIHYSKENNEEKFIYFSKRGFNYSDHFNEILTPKFSKQLKKNVNSFILDGEMMAWHKTRETYTNKAEEVDVKTLTIDNPNHTVVFVAFDLLYLNSEVLTSKPLTTRVEYLEQIFQPKEGVCIISKVETVHDKSRIVDALNEAIDNLEEGLVVKIPTSIYEPGKRNENWFKIKPEFFDDSSVTDLDLLILGAYYSDSARRARGLISHFLVGLIDKENRGDHEYYPICRVGSGHLTHVQMKKLVEELEPNFTKREFGNVSNKWGKRPDFFIDPKCSIVVSVKGSEIISSKEYILNYTLRFARVTQVRRDKNYDDILTVKEFHDLREKYGGKLVKRLDGKKPNYFRKGTTGKRKAEQGMRRKDVDSEDEDFHNISIPPKKALMNDEAAKSQASASTFKSISSSLTGCKNKKKVKKNVFEGRIFFLFGGSFGDDEWKKEKEASIKLFGGEIVQNPTKNTFCIISRKGSESFRINNYMNLGTYDIVKPHWLDACLTNEEFIDLNHEDFWFITESTSRSFADNFDVYGDHHTKKNDLETTKKLVDRVTHTLMKKNKGEISPTSAGKITEAVNQEMFSLSPLKLKEMESFSFLKNTRIIFKPVGFSDLLLNEKISFYGGQVVEDQDEAQATHIVITDENTFSYVSSCNRGAMVVRMNWLEDALMKKELLDEYLYCV